MKTLFKSFCFLAVIAALVIGLTALHHKQAGGGPYLPSLSSVTSLCLPDDAKAEVKGLRASCPACLMSTYHDAFEACRVRCKASYPDGQTPCYNACIDAINLLTKDCNR